MYLFFAISGLVNFITSGLLGTLVYFKNRKNIINKIFGLFCLCLTLWSLFYIFWPLSKTKESTFLFFRLLHLSTFFLSTLYLHFVTLFLDIYNKKYKRIIYSGYILATFFLLFSFSPLFLKEMIPKFSMRYWAVPGILYHFYVAQLFGYMIYSNYLLYKNLKESSGVKRSQIEYLIIGTIILYISGGTNYALFYNINLPPYLNILSSGFVITTAYAIIKYRFMDIRFILGRGAVYFSSFATVTALTFLLMFLNNQLSQPLSFNVAGPLIVVLSVIFFQFILRFFEKLASKYFYYTFYSYQKVLTDLGERLTKVLELDKLSSLIVSTLRDTMKLDRTVVLLRELEGGDYQIQENIGFKEENGISLVKDNFLTLYLEENKKPVVEEELFLAVRDSQDLKEKGKLKKLQTNMKRIEAALCLPLFIEEKIIGMIILGNKISKEHYSAQDIELLTILTNQASIAFQNARSYSQIEDLSENLQEKVDEQTKELKKAYDDLKVLDESKSEFISMASHQLRTPLSAIKGYISMLIEGSYGEISEKAREKLNNVFQSNERLIKIVNDLLDISKVEMGKMELEKAPTQLEDLLQSCYEEMKIGAEKKSVKFILKKPKTPLPKIEIDSLKMRQVFLNLIDNAIKYTQKGKIEIEIEKKDSRVSISVRDTGEGLSLKEKRDAFGGFTRGSAGLAYFIEGAGLGLYVAKKFLELQGGKIWVESEGKGKGSTFYVELPLK